MLVRVFALLLLTSVILCAQEYNFRTFGVAEGLNNLAVRQIYQDRVGFIWVSTEDGIFRYDGERFQSFGPEQGIPSTSGAAFGDAPDGSLLVGGDFGLYQLSGNRFEKLAVDFKTVSWAQGIKSDGKGPRLLARTPVWWSSIPNPGTIGSQCGSSLKRPEHPGLVLTAFPWMATSCGTDAETNCAAWTEVGLQFSDGTVDFRIASG